MQTPRIQTICQNSRIHHIDRGGVKNTSAESNFTFRACVRNENDNCLRIPFRQEDLNHHGVKEKHQPLCQKLVLLMWNDSKTNTIPGYRFAISLSFCNGCNWVQNECCRVQIRLGGCNIELSFCYLLFRPRLPCVGL